MVGATRKSVNKTPRNDKDRMTPDVTLMIPWSAREGFTEAICDLPGSQEGCWRWRRFAQHGTQLNVPGIGPGNQQQIDPIVAWITYERGLKEQNVRVDVSNENPKFHPGRHQIIFGFTETGLKHFRAESEEGFYPNSVEYRGAKAGTTKSANIKSWIHRTSASDVVLSECFGSLTFRREKIYSKEFKIDCQRSISELIRTYLNHHPDCHFRRDVQRRGIGISTCKLDVKLRETKWDQQKRTNIKKRITDKANLWENCAITFSYIDPGTLQVRRIPDLCLGGLESELVNQMTETGIAYDDCFHSLSVNDPGELCSTNYAYCFSRYGRQQVLPSEVGESFLIFSPGEIAAYLLHWFLLRIFANRSPENEAFIEKFQKWRKLVTDEGKSQPRLFADLLESAVVLPICNYLFREQVFKLTSASKYLGIYESPTAFGDVLSTIGLGSAYAIWKRQLFSFFMKFFSPENADQKLSMLPMYQKLGWQRSTLFKSLESSRSNNEEGFEAVLSCVAQAPIFDEEIESTCVEELKNHVRRCVFPIYDILANLPFDHELPVYFIFPLWEETIRHWRGPVLFAHVISNGLNSDSEEFTNKDAIDVGKAIHQLLLPFGAAVAHSYYTDLRKQATESEKKMLLMGGIAHAAGNALAMAGISQLTSYVSTRLVSDDAHNEARELCQGAEVGERSARSFLAFVEIAVNPGPLRRKFQSRAPYTLKDCVVAANEMTKIYRQRQASQQHNEENRLAQLKLHWDADRCKEITFPQGYLSETYIATFLYEIFLNVILHGGTIRENGVSISEAELMLEHNDNLFEIHTDNVLEPNDHKSWTNVNNVTIPGSIGDGKTRLHTFLGFASTISSYIPGIQFSSRIWEGDGFRFYRSTLLLGSIAVEAVSESTGQRITKVITPI
jgi:hypothetical protein